MAHAKENFIELLWKINNADLGDMQDIQECMMALMIRHGVKYKELTELNEEDYEFCVDHFASDVEDAFCDKVNTQGINYYEFQRFCQLFMDFSKMYNKEQKKKDLFTQLGNLLMQNSETRLGYVVKN